MLARCGGIAPRLAPKQLIDLGQKGRIVRVDLPALDHGARVQLAVETFQMAVEALVQGVDRVVFKASD